MVPGPPLEVDTDQLVLAQHWVWDTAEDADEFNRAFETYGDHRWGNSETNDNRYCWSTTNGQECLIFNGQHSLWLSAPNADILEAVLALYPDVR